MSQHTIDYNTIHKHLKQLKFNQNSSVNGSLAQLDEQIAIKYISILRQDLINIVASTNNISQVNPKTLNEILVLTKTLDYVPKSDKLFSLFDAQLFRTLFDLACRADLPVEALRGILRICLTYLAGVLPKTRKQGMFKVLLGVLCEPEDNLTDNSSIKSLNSINNINDNEKNVNNNNNNHTSLRCDLLFASLTSRITFADARMNLNIVDFVAKVFYRLMESISLIANNESPLITEEQWLFNVIRSLYVNNFFGVLSCIKGIGEIEGMTGLRGSMELTSKWLENKKFDLKNSILLECCNLAKEVGIILNDEDLQNINELDNQINKPGIKVSSCGILSILSIIGALNQPKRSLKKILVECNMNSTFPILKFMTIINSIILSKKSLNRIFGIWNTELLYSLLSVGTRCWLFSNAKAGSDDINKVINMVEVVIIWLSKNLDNGDINISTNTNNYNNNFNNSNNVNNEIVNVTQDDIEINPNNNNYDVISLLEKVDSFDYNEIKSLQLQEIRLKHAVEWGAEMRPFEDLVHRQVIALVRDQRFLQLSKGSWVYAVNPLDSGDHRHYFLTLNSSSQSIVYKEFTKRPPRNSQAPNLDKDGIYIEFKNIIGIESENLNPNINDTGLISIQSERMDVNKVEVITKNKIFEFYVDTKQLKDIWVDGLRILVADSKVDSKEKDLTSKEQINSSPMKLSISEEFVSNSGVSDDVRGQIKALEDIRIRTQMLDLNEKIKNSQSNFIDWATLSTNFYYD